MSAVKNMNKGFYIFCDESVKKGKYYSNFYGGALLKKDDLEGVNNALLQAIAALGIEDSELKWSKINTHRVEAYKAIMDVFFDYIKTGKVKLRIMFTDNRNMVENANKEYKNRSYHLLYYQFIKHTFGLAHLISDEPIDLELFFDILPQTSKSNKAFKKYIFGIQFLPELINTNLVIKKESIYEVDSKKHAVLQCVDIVLGAIAFRMNDKHKEKPLGKRIRGKRTIAKEQVYKHISKLIRDIKPNFNIGKSTSAHEPIQRFTDPYRHWIFIPKESEFVGGGKNKKRSE